MDDNKNTEPSRTWLAQAIAEKRMAILHIERRFMRELFRGKLRGFKLTGCPEDTEVHHLYTSECGLAVVLVLVHPSFDPVPLNQYPPPCVGTGYELLPPDVHETPV